MRKRFTAIDLFSGIGGFRIAIERCGGHCIAFSEINTDAINAYISNYSETKEANLGDITAIRSLPNHDLLTAGVPCQSWSIAGRNLGFDDDRGQLWNDALYLLNKSQPKAFIFENVKGLADPRNEASLDYIMGRIKDAGYYAKYYVLNSFDYGVPQSRVRIYIIGFREKCYFESFKQPLQSNSRVMLKDIMDCEIIQAPNRSNEDDFNLFGLSESPKTGNTSLSRNNNGHNDYFLFNDIRNGATTVHTWDIIETTPRQKHICLVLLRNRRKKTFGPLDGNPLALEHFKSIDSTIDEEELNELVSLGILKKEKYAYSLVNDAFSSDKLHDDERLVLSGEEGLIISDKLVCKREFKTKRVNIKCVLDKLESRGIIQCVESRYEFRYTKISTGLFGISRIFLPSSDIFPTLVASDNNDFLTPVSITAVNEQDYRNDFIKYVLEEKQYRKISKTEACRVQGFPDNFILPESRARWMKLIGNSVSIPVVEKLVHRIVETGVFSSSGLKRGFISTPILDPNSNYIKISNQKKEQLCLF
jgi:DNA (cytosine-5)-methyltransferase 1